MTGYKTFAYADSEAYEQSLDVYRPTVPATGAPVVVLIPGSGWLGHRAFLYRLFGLQNSLGARSLAEIGCTCVCVRHRGAFIKPPPATFFALLAAVAMCLCDWFGLVMWAAWALLASGAATHDEMLDDVARALAWVHSSEAELVGDIVGHRELSPLEPARPKRVLGGYSSGGHLVVSLLQRPEKLKQWGLPHEAAGFDGIFLISGVLATRSAAPLPALRSARALTWLVTRGVFGFGDDGGSALPSPLHGSMSSLACVPWLLLHCKHEAFAIGLIEDALSHLLCTPQFGEALKASHISVRNEAVESHHWAILGSNQLREALRTVLLLEQSWPPVNSQLWPPRQARPSDGLQPQARRTRTRSRRHARPSDEA